VNQGFHSVVLHRGGAVRVVAVDFVGFYTGTRESDSACREEPSAGRVRSSLVEPVDRRAEALHEGKRPPTAALGVKQRLDHEDCCTFAQRQSGAAGIEWGRRGLRERFESVKPLVDERMKGFGPSDEDLVAAAVLQERECLAEGNCARSASGSCCEYGSSGARRGSEDSRRTAQQVFRLGDAAFPIGHRAL
jgi:hypothetical protein